MPNRAAFTDAVLGLVGHARRCATTGAGDGDSVENRGGATVAVFDVVVDISVVAQRQWVSLFIAASMQRQVPAVWVSTLCRKL